MRHFTHVEGWKHNWSAFWSRRAIQKRKFHGSYPCLRPRDIEAANAPPRLESATNRVKTKARLKASTRIKPSGVRSFSRAAWACGSWLRAAACSRLDNSAAFNWEPPPKSAVPTAAITQKNPKPKTPLTAPMRAPAPGRSDVCPLRCRYRRTAKAPAAAIPIPKNPKNTFIRMADTTPAIAAAVKA